MTQKRLICFRMSLLAQTVMRAVDGDLLLVPTRRIGRLLKSVEW